MFTSPHTPLQSMVLTQHEDPRLQQQLLLCMKAQRDILSTFPVALATYTWAATIWGPMRNEMEL